MRKIINPRDYWKTRGKEEPETVKGMAALLVVSTYYLDKAYWGTSSLPQNARLDILAQAKAVMPLAIDALEQHPAIAALAGKFIDQYRGFLRQINIPYEEEDDVPF